MTERQYQALDETGLYQPGVHRQVTRVVERDGGQYVPGTGITLDALQHYQQLGRRLQARAVAEGLSKLFRGTVRAFVKPAAALGRARREAAAIRDLRRLDDRLLADIGITRGQIPAVVAGLEARGAVDTPVRPAVVARVSQATRVPEPQSSNDANDRKAA